MADQHKTEIVSYEHDLGENAPPGMDTMYRGTCTCGFSYVNTTVPAVEAAIKAHTA